jgi:hypothetical protein
MAEDIVIYGIEATRKILVTGYSEEPDGGLVQHDA